MTNKLREAAQQALSTLEGWAGHGKWIWPESALEQAKRNTEEAITAIKEALEKPQQEPVAWMCSNIELMHKGYQRFSATEGGDWNIPVYTAPQPTKQPLTDEELGQCAEAMAAEPLAEGWTELKKFARAIEAKLREKNGGQK